MCGIENRTLYDIEKLKTFESVENITRFILVGIMFVRKILK